MMGSAPGGGQDEWTIGPYPVLAMLGENEATQAWLCRSLDDPRRVFVRSLRIEWARQPHLKDAFLEAARVQSLLAHAYIPHVEDVGEHDGVPFTVQTYVEGPSLAQILERQRQRGRLDLRLGVRLCIQVAEALAHAYNALDEGGRPMRVVHGRVTPDRILVAASGQAALIGFRPPGHDHPHEALPYLAPEVLLHGTTSHQGDLFALGVILFRACVSDHPWHPAEAAADVATGRIHPPRPLPGIPQPIADVLARCLAARPEDRYPHAGEMAYDLSAWWMANRPMSEADVYTAIEDLYPEGPAGWASIETAADPQPAGPRFTPLVPVLLVAALLLGGTLLLGSVVVVFVWVGPVGDPQPEVFLEDLGRFELERAEQALAAGDLELAGLALDAAETLQVAKADPDRYQALQIRLHLARQVRAIQAKIAVDPEAALVEAEALSEAFPGETIALEVMVRAGDAVGERRRALSLANEGATVGEDMATIRISGGAVGLSVFIDALQIGQTPLDHEVPPGTHQLTVRGPDRILYDAEIVVTAGEAFELALTPDADGGG